jgi:hypothetical protein
MRKCVFWAICLKCIKEDIDLKRRINDAHDAFVQSLNAGRRRQKLKVLALIIVIIIAIATFFVVRAIIKHKREVDAAKKSMVQIDIHSTFKEAEFPPEGDWDGDGLKNKQELDGIEIEFQGEKQIVKPNVQSEDSDGDGISDGDEIQLGLNPLNEDTDGDGILDGYELIAGLNPKWARSDEATNDADRIMDVVKKCGELTLTIHGNANCAEVTIEELDLVGITANASVLSKVYNIYSDNKFEKGTLKFDVDLEKLKRVGLELTDLAVHKFDVEKKKYTKVDSRADKQNKTVSADITGLGTYVLGVEKTVNVKPTTRVFFLIDNSGSMYPEKMCAGSTENDIDFKRLSFAQSLIGRFEDDYQVGISKFTGTYTKMTDFTTNKKQLGDVLSKIKNEKEVFNGTHSQTALSNCINEFGADAANVKYSNIIVMLTDGESDEVGGAKLDELIKQAKNKSILILTVGLGRDVDREWLQKLASETGGKYYAASDANALDDVYKSIVTTLNYEIVTYSGRDNVKGYSLYNTGFDPKKNGFAFKNFRTATTSSVDFGMAVMARDWYIGKLQTTLGGLEPGDDSEQKVSAEGYDIKGTKFGDVYDQRRELHAVNSDLFSGKYSDVTKYLDFSSSGDVLKVDEDCKSDALDKGWKITNSPLEGSSLKWDSVDLLSLDIADSYDKIESGYDKDSAEFAKALYRLNSLQWDDGRDEFKLTDKDGFETITKQLSLGVPVVTTIDGTHTINAIGLIQDSLCHRKYIFQVYDNNYPNEKKELYLEKKMILRLKITDGVPEIEKTDFTYSAKYEGKQVGLSFSKVEEH